MEMVSYQGEPFWGVSNLALSLKQRRAFVFPDDAPQSRNFTNENLSQPWDPIVFIDPLHPRLLHVQDGYRNLPSQPVLASLLEPGKMA
jgi:hypothetical protein